jgi:hypothetical protein
VINVGASLSKSFNNTVVNPFHCQQQGNRAQRWRLLLSSVLGAFLISASAQASPVQLGETPTDITSGTGPVSSAIEDGIYFYGSAPQPDELGAAYLVFTAQNAEVVGAIFMPHSSFDCFQGSLQANELALQITNSYTQETYAYDIALVTDQEPIASSEGASLPLKLDGFHNLGAPRATEMEILSTCQTNSLPPAELEL